MLADRVAQLKDELSSKAGLEPLQDRYVVGVLAGYNDLLNINVDEVSNGD